mmetsp:Transcript_72802/g.213556  ORF Transcript_72802/g.213556 Transcript_72802/m.213556 type:complete len:1035 (-) Transcript_72802:174-3278(-)
MGNSPACADVSRNCSPCAVEKDPRVTQVPVAAAPVDYSVPYSQPQGQGAFNNQAQGQYQDPYRQASPKPQPPIEPPPPNTYEVAPASPVQDYQQEQMASPAAVTVQIEEPPRPAEAIAPSQMSTQEGAATAYDSGPPQSIPEAAALPASPPAKEATGPAAGAKGRGDPENEPEPPPENEEEQPIEYDAATEFRKAIMGLIFVIVAWALVVLVPQILSASMDPPVCTEEEEEVSRICDLCGGGELVVPYHKWYERTWPKMFRAVLYLVGLLWTFLGVAIVCDQFMGAIEEITNQERVKYVEIRPGSGTKRKFHVKVWNPTVANLTLMALGSSAPEILLAVIEIISGQFFAGELGPSTIVGSAAFNLLMITAVCIIAIPDKEIRKIAQTDVFLVTASFSILAYVWMLFILQVTTPDQVTLTEALLTFFQFPLIVILAYMADRGVLCVWCKGKTKSGMEISEADVIRLQSTYGKELPDEVVKTLMEREAKAANLEPPASRSERRRGITAGISGGNRNVGKPEGKNEVLFSFTDRQVVVLECAGSVQLKVVASKAPGQVVNLRYRTREATAKEGERYQHVEGILTFGATQTEKIIEIPVIDDEQWQDNEYFSCEIFDLQASGVSARSKGQPGDGACRIGLESTQIMILNDDMPGTLSFDVDEVYGCEGEPVKLGLMRTHGTCGRITAQYRTVSETAVPNRDYQPAEGVLTMEHGVAFTTISVPILKSRGHKFETRERFKVVVDNASPGIKFDTTTDGGATSAICDIIIGADRAQGLFSRASSTLINVDKNTENFAAWYEQVVAAIYCNGSPAEQVGATAQDWFFHLLSVTWKLLFSLIPPPGFGGGWLCFCCALACTGGVTAIIGDMASNLGCCIGISDSVTAITLVALGTSLPDTFASKLAAQQEPTADNSIGNVTGSNCVNVYLGLGLPWTLAALYWVMAGRNDDWETHKYKGEVFSELFPIEKYPEGGFMVPAGTLGASVTVFSSCAVTCLALLAFRRFTYGGELGGPKAAQWRDFAILAMLWGVYICGSIIAMS